MKAAFAQCDLATESWATELTKQLVRLHGERGELTAAIGLTRRQESSREKADAA